MRSRSGFGLCSDLPDGGMRTTPDPHRLSACYRGAASSASIKRRTWPFVPDDARSLHEAEHDQADHDLDQRDRGTERVAGAAADRSARPGADGQGDERRGCQGGHRPRRGL
jgi:hypothetical protein